MPLESEANPSLKEVNLSNSTEDGLDAISKASAPGDNDWYAVYRPTTVKITYEQGQGFSRYKPSLKHLIPLRVKNGEASQMPVDFAGFFSFGFFSWLSPLVWRAYKRDLREEDLFVCSPFDSAKVNGMRLSALWNVEKNKLTSAPCSFTRLLYTFVGTRFFISCLVYLICLFFGFIGPTVFMQQLLESINNPHSSSTQSVLLVVGLVLSELFRLTFFSLLWAVNLRTALRASSGTMACLYAKLMKLHPASYHKSHGEIVSLFANDCQKLYQMVTNGPLLVGGPLLILATVVYMWFLIGPFALVPLAVFLLFYILQYLISKLSMYYRKRTMVATDQRTKLMTEFLTYIKLIKLHAWEKPLAETLTDVREEEHGLLEKSQYLQALGNSSALLTPFLATILTILAYTLARNPLPVPTAFIIVMLNFITSHGIRTLPILIQAIVNGRVALRRIEAILNMEDKDSYITLPLNPTLAVYVQKAILSWKPDFTCVVPTGKEEIADHGDENSQLMDPLPLPRGPELSGITLAITKGQLVGIYGPVGSGKSSLLAALMSQMYLLSGQVCVRGSIAYTSQQPWILNSSFQENIVFGHPFNSKKYYEAIYSCALTDDVSALPAGDKTKVGDGGATLSGGQRHRVALARALYADRDVYLLDEPFSALDPATCNHVFQHCVRGALRARTVLLVTNNPTLLAECDQVVVMRGGSVEKVGTHGHLIETDAEYAALMARKPNPLLDESKRFQSEEMLPKYPAVNGPLTLSPEDGLEKSSSVSRGTYTIYIAAAGGLIMAAMVTLWFILQGSLAVFANWWLSHWLDKGSGIMIDQNATAPEEINILDNPDLDFYQTIYGLTAGLLITCSLVMGFLFTKCSLRATNVLHHQLFWKLCHCPMNFFDMVPTGRILNLFTRDLEEVDCQLPPVLYQLLQKAVLVALKVLVMIVVFPYSLPGLVLVAALFGLLYTSFRSAVRSLKRLEATHRAPLLSLLLESLQGLSVIQAFHKQEDFRNWFSNLVDKYSAPLYLYECSLRWMIARIDLLCTAVTLTVCLVAVFTRDSVTSGLAALAIVYAVQITSQLYMVGRQAVTCESHFTAVERIHTYMAELEGEPGGKAEPPLDWPTRGRLLFHDVTLRYRPGLPLALKGVSFELQPGDRVAVVGHSGAGKSSLGAALFRLVELSSGTIFLDGVDISTLRVEALRAAMAIIPQDPVLFQGTIRYNLDPLQVHEDEELWDALERTHIKDKVTSLNLAVQEGGVNFSVGEKQLLSMARALLSKSKVVVLDEATASIDPATDDLIQSTITEVFKDCTVLAIAHRLSTVQHYPKVLVMQDGKVMEFDSTQTLFDNPHSAFSQLMASFSTN